MAQAVNARQNVHVVRLANLVTAHVCESSDAVLLRLLALIRPIVVVSLVDRILQNQCPRVRSCTTPTPTPFSQMLQAAVIVDLLLTMPPQLTTRSTLEVVLDTMVADGGEIIETFSFAMIKPAVSMLEWDKHGKHTPIVATPADDFGSRALLFVGRLATRRKYCRQ